MDGNLTGVTTNDCQTNNMTTPTQFNLPSSNFNAIQHQQFSQQKYNQEVVSMAAAVSTSNSPNSSPSSSSSQQYLVQQQMFSQQNHHQHHHHHHQQHHQTSLPPNQTNSDISDSYQYAGIRNNPTSNSFPTPSSFTTSENASDHTNETAASVTTIDSMRDQKIFALPPNNSSLPETFPNSNSAYVAATNYNLKTSRRLSTPIEIEHDTSHVGSHRVRSQTLPLYQNGNTAAAYQSQQQLAHITDMNSARYSAAPYPTAASSFLTLDRRTVNNANVPILPILQPFSNHSKIVQLPPPIDVGVTENASEPWRTINGLVMPDNNAPTSLQLGLHAQKHKAFDDTMSRTTVGAIDPVFTTHDPVAMKQNNNNISNTMPPYYSQPQGYDRNIHQGNIPPTMSTNPDYSMMPPRFTPNGNISPTMPSNGNKVQAQAPTRPPPVPAPAAMMTTFSSKTVSSTPKRYKCTICQKRFTRPSSLQTHMYSHTGEKPFKCPVEGCGRHFSVVSNLRRHQKIHAAPP